jgi:hypothetical protein
MGKTTKKFGLQEGTDGSFRRIMWTWLGSQISFGRTGIGEGRTRPVGRNSLSLSFLFTPIVKGDSYPELCAQRTDEGGGFPMFARVQDRRGVLESVSVFPFLSLSFLGLPLATYPMGMKAVK